MKVGDRVSYTTSTGFCSQTYVGTIIAIHDDQAWVHTDGDDDFITELEYLVPLITGQYVNLNFGGVYEIEVKTGRVIRVIKKPHNVLPPGWHAPMYVPEWKDASGLPDFIPFPMTA